MKRQTILIDKDNPELIEISNLTPFLVESLFMLIFYLGIQLRTAHVKQILISFLSQNKAVGGT
jgi:hypothetical protein